MAEGAGSVFQAGNSVGSGYVQAQAMRDQADYEKKLNEINNKTLDAQIEAKNAQAADAEKRGNQAANKRVQEERLQVGEQRAAIAAGGGDLTGEMATNVVGQTETVSAADQQAIHVNSFREAFGYKSQGLAIKGEQNNNNLQTTSRVNALNYGAKTSIINGWTNAVGYGASGYGDYKKNQKPEKGAK